MLLYLAVLMLTGRRPAGNYCRLSQLEGRNLSVVVVVGVDVVNVSRWFVFTQMKSRPASREFGKAAFDHYVSQRRRRRCLQPTQRRRFLFLQTK